MLLDPSANGAEYNSQGQALSTAKHVPPGWKNNNVRALKSDVRYRHTIYCALPVLSNFTPIVPGATLPRYAQHLPLAITVRAVGAAEVALQS